MVNGGDCTCLDFSCIERLYRFLSIEDSLGKEKTDDEERRPGKSVGVDGDMASGDPGSSDDSDDVSTRDDERGESAAA